MRIIAGTWRGRRIIAPDAAVTRPYTDRVREAVFDALGSRLGTPGELPPIAVLDLFAGSGAMGLEALSRGAVACTFVENHPVALKCLRENVAKLGAGERCRIVAVDVARLTLGLGDRPRGASAGAGEQRIELVFVDPPYRMTAGRTRGRSIPGMLARLADQPGVARGALLLLRHERTVRFDRAALARYEMLECRDYGSMSVTWLRLVDAPRPGGSEV